MYYDCTKYNIIYNTGVMLLEVHLQVFTLSELGPFWYLNEGKHQK